MSMETPFGLRQYPVTKFCMVTTAAIPIVASIANCKYIFLTRYEPFISEYQQYYRLALFELGATNESDVLLLMLIWYQFRHLERIMGSYKYISVISLIYLYTSVILTTLYIGLNVLLSQTIWNSLPQGSLPVVMAMLHFYKEFTPKIYDFKIVVKNPLSSSKDKRANFECHLDDQFFVLSLIFALLLNQGYVGISCGFLCWLIGVFIDKGIFVGFHNWRLPFIKHWLSDENNLTRETGIASSSGPNINTYINNVREGSNNLQEMEGHDYDEENQDDEPARPLGVQFLDAFRR
ncbi:hypothetical protein KAFR_0C01190 [Kazachstania africana CBS 2517]|uniref:Derlin n=1 Tax=Kazachstania africana (strain ATCC 22294 / BCRC 22015 / CBS 2517 / CECT 1963 / NBRC 1671 / NRRL Y-8276) TaxID=1071382 RepID=H2ARW4_KAZAF|nr:hypothetical protein KAFR_0C01190 [Kazachstania africana CBS 2517]CCF57114.1 hypothetical protein KAFR_0C01190 [Kazachstania africana CBS 2517]